MNVVINDILIREAFKYSKDVRTEQELFEIALQEYIMHRKQKNLKDLRGKITFREDYDYKKMREMR